MSLYDSIIQSRKVLAKTTDQGQALFVPKEIIYEYAGKSLKRDLEFQRYIEIQEMQKTSKIQNALSNFKIYCKFE